MAKEKKISINAMDKIVKENYTAAVTEQWHDIEIVIKPLLDFKEMLSFVHEVVQSCFSDDTGEYLPEVKDFAIKSNVLERYANFSLPDNLEHRYALIYKTDAVEAVLKYVNRSQFREIMESVDKKLEQMASANVQQAMKQVNAILDTLNESQRQLETLFSGISSDDIGRLIGAMADGGIDEGKIVEAYIEKTRAGGEDG